MGPILKFIRRADGQDLAEYCLITALVALLAGAVLFQVSGGMKSLWNSATQTTSSAANTLSGGQSGAVSRGGR
jgi:Flp pilus assembly pilin Flp